MYESLYKTSDKEEGSSYSIDIIFILDESGSMLSMGNEPVDAINDFINDQKELKDNATFTLYTFNNKHRLIIDDKPLSNIKNITYAQYIPKNTTALYDAIAHAINDKKQKPSNKNVVMVILTDGYENSSQNYVQNDIKRMINEMKDEYNWKFVFLGANQDAIITGGKIGVHTCCTFSTVSGGDKGAAGYSDKSTLPSMSNACKSVSTSVKKYKVDSCKTKNTNVDIKLEY